MPATLSKFSRCLDGKTARIDFVHGMVDKRAQDAFITKSIPYFHRARKLGELRQFYHMVLTIWFDIWPERSQNKVVVMRNRFVSERLLVLVSY